MDRETESDFYSVCRFLNEPKRYVGCTKDELFPALGILLLGMITGYLFCSMAISAIWIFGVKYLKRRYGSAFLLVGVYWYTSSAISNKVFNQTPPSELSYWLR